MCADLPVSLLAGLSVPCQIMDPPTTASERLRHAVAPLLLPLLAFFLVSQAAYAASVLAAAVAWLAGSPSRAMVAAPLVYISFGAAQVCCTYLTGSQLICLLSMVQGCQWERGCGR